MNKTNILLEELNRKIRIERIIKKFETRDKVTIDRRNCWINNLDSDQLKIIETLLTEMTID